MVLTQTHKMLLCITALLILPITMFAQTEIPADSLAAQAEICFQEGKFAKSDSLYTLALAVERRERGEHSSGYITILCGYIDLCINADKLEGLRSKIDYALAARAKNSGKNPLEYAEILCHLGKYLLYTFKFNEAEEVLEKALQIHREKLGKESSVYAHALIGMGAVQTYKQEFTKAQEIYKEASNMAARMEDGRNQSLADITLATQHAFTGKNKEALELFTSALKLSREAFGEQHPTYVTHLSNYGTLLIVSGDYLQAESLLTQTLALAERVLGEEHRQYLITLKALANVYLTQGKYQQTESLLLKSIRISKKLYGDNSPEYASALNLLGSVYMNLGDYPRAEQTLVQSIEILSKHPEAFRLSKASNLNSLGAVYRRQHRYDEALKLFREALEVQKQDRVLDNFLSLAIINNICATLIEDKTQDLSLIEQDLLAVLDIHKHKGSTATAYLHQLTNLTALYRISGQYDKALARAKEAITGYEQGLNTENWHFINLLQHYAQTLHLAGDPEQTLATYSRCLHLMKVLAARDFFFLTEREREIYWKSYYINLKEYLNFVVNSNHLAEGFGYDCELVAKSLLLSSELSIQNIVLNSNDPNLTALWQEIKSKSNKRTQEQERMFLTALAKQDIAGELSMNWQQVQRTLGSNEAAIEIINAPTKMDGTGEIRYYALILTRLLEKPQLVPLCSHDEVAHALQEEEKSLQMLYQLAWKPLESHLQQIEKIYIAPSGLFNNISFEALQDEKGYLVDRYEVRRLLSTRDIPKLKSRTSPHWEIKPSLALFGGADYGMPPAPVPAEQKNYRMYGQGFDYLPGSLKEVSQIQSITTRKKWKVSLFTGAEASEERFKSYSGNSPEIIHISTHGFYFPSRPPDSLSASPDHLNRFQASLEPLMRSGLLFSGANKVWTRPQERDENTEDGVLTAEEIARFDFSNTKLVVLSACNTALGDIDYNEGIYGLQRALRLAGVPAMVVALWKVPDKETTWLMTEFYEKLSLGLSPKEALEKARFMLRKRYPNEPEKWGAFVLIE